MPRQGLPVVTERYIDVERGVDRYVREVKLDDFELRPQLELVGFGEPIREEWQPVEQRCHVGQHVRHCSRLVDGR